MGWTDAQDEAMGTDAEHVKVAAPLDIEKGVCYLIKEKKPELGFRLFSSLLQQRIPGLCVTRQHPERVRRERGLSDVRILWLSHTPGEDFHNPTAIGTLAKVISKFIEDNAGEGVVLLDGLEYLVINNGFLQTLMFVEHVNEFVMQRKAILLMPVSPETLEEKERALLERNVEVIETPTLKADMEMREVGRILDTY
ncbi:MAG TPA: DUF835 domain-containing protein [Thermoplasmata archaeon]|nr:DUF835 domain-containing protein [Thermoplasmata archaeon]